MVRCAAAVTRNEVTVGRLPLVDWVLESDWVVLKVGAEVPPSRLDTQIATQRSQF